MFDMDKMCKIIEDELHKISEKGLNTSNLETAYKLIDMYKDIKNTEYWDKKGEYYMAVLDEMQGGYSQGGYSQRGYQKRDSRGRYSRETGPVDEESVRMRSSHYPMYSYRGYSMADGMSHDRCMHSKESYRAEKSPECKQRLMDTLEEYMGEFSEQLEDMLKDSDCREEKEIINRYLKKLQTI